MKIAVEGCCHGELDKIYETVAFLEKTNNMKVDLLLICGDFQAVRNKSDLETMAVPPKYRKMNTFWKYYSGAKTAPILTIMIGGNHEASNYLQELPYGGWIAPNIYYLGYAGVVNCGGVRIGGMSGIFKGRDYNRGHYEHPPYNEDTKRSCYHVRNLEVFRLKQLKEPVDIMISHDWPRGIYNYGNVNALLSKKKFFREEVENGTLGNPPAEELLHHMKPSYWFAAHLHVKFAAVVDHEGETPKQTRFLSLDKCLPRRKFLQVIDVEGDSNKPVELELDREWMAILKSTNHLLNLGRRNTYMPGPGCSERFDFTPTPQELQTLHDDFEGVFTIPKNFEKSAEAYKPEEDRPKQRVEPPQMIINAQTTLLCEMLSLTNPFAVFTGKQQHTQSLMAQPMSDSLDDSALLDDSDFLDSTVDTTTVDTTLETTANPDEISLDDLDDVDEGDDVESADDAVTSSPLPKSIGLSLPPPLLTPVHLMNPDKLNVDLKDPIVKRLIITDDSSENLNASADSNSSESSGKRSFSVDNENLSSTTGDESSPTKKPVKKFKRRNQAIYDNDES